MKLLSARILLVIFTLSVSLTQVIELGHEMLHSFKNPIHYHKVRQHKDFKDHSLADHHFPKMKFAHQMDEPQAPTNFIAIAYVFFQALEVCDFSNRSLTRSFTTRVVEYNYGVDHAPPTPPPLAVV